MKPVPVCLVAAALFVAGCTGSASTIATQVDSGAEAPRIIQPGAPGQASRALPDEAITAREIPYTEADVQFMQGMIGHHAQALDMTALIADRTNRQDLALLGRRIEISQKSEIALMQKWLSDRGEAVPDATAHHMMMGHMDAMPGMLSAEQMEQLKAASGDEFYRLWLEFMIQHHQGAITMVGELLAAEGAAQETDIFKFADAVEEDQAMEIQRMRQMLERLR
ncbi:MAG: DUF305 domain-containing protein [Rhodothermales bacterium]|nr:DUF305 domain-containing protein [Rhodothermales bacterium]